MKAAHVSRVVRIAITMIFCGAAALWAGEKMQMERIGPADPFAQCEDKIAAQVQVNSRLATPFFKKRELHYPWWIIEHDDGHLENTVGAELTAEDRTKVEWTSNCYSTHQGHHRMKMCDATLDGTKLRLTIWGGLPAYVGSVDILIDGDDYRCAFGALPSMGPSDPDTAVTWRITKKQLHVKSKHHTIGRRFYAWLSIEFEEGWSKGGKISWRPYKAEGYVKPVLAKAPP